MTAPTEPLKLWVCLCCGETWKDTADLTPTWDGYGHVVSPEDLCGEVVEYAPVVARDPAAELRAAVKAYFEAVHEYELFRVQEGDGPYPVSDEGDRFVELSHDLADAELRLKTLAATEGKA